MDSSLRERIHMIRKQLKQEKRKAAAERAERAEKTGKAGKASQHEPETEMMTVSEPEPETVPDEKENTDTRKAEVKADTPGLLGKLSKWIWRS